MKDRSCRLLFTGLFTVGRALDSSVARGTGRARRGLTRVNTSDRIAQVEKSRELASNKIKKREQFIIFFVCCKLCVQRLVWILLKNVKVIIV